jgi:hypothetical protein
MSGSWRRLVGPFQEFGWAAGILYILDRMLRAVSPHLALYVYELMVQPITGKPMLPANLVKNLTFAEILPGDPSIDLMPARPEVKVSRFEQGARCLGVFRKGVLIGYLWFCFGQYDEDEVRCTYRLVAADESVFDFDLYVFPEQRMGIGFMAIWHGANEFLHARGIRYTFSRLTRFNLASRRAHAHLGWKCAGRAVFVRAWRLELMVASTSPYLAVTCSPSRRIRLPLTPHVLDTALEKVPDSQAVNRQAPRPLNPNRRL